MLAESLVRSLIRGLVTIAILAAVYFFIVKPVLDTTEDTVNGAFEQSFGIQQEVNDSLESAGIGRIELGDPSSIENRIGDVDLSTAIANAPDRRTKRLLRCIDRADGEIEKISRCTNP